MVFKHFSVETSGVGFGVLGFVSLMGTFLFHILDFDVRFNLAKKTGILPFQKSSMQFLNTSVWMSYLNLT